MKIRDILEKKRPTLSFEVFPPKKEAQFAAVREAALDIARLKPDFMSVTYGAGGGTSRYTMDIAHEIEAQCGVAGMAHLTCISSTKQGVKDALDEIEKKGIENILALRGDIPQDGSVEDDYRHASELIEDIRKRMPQVTIGAACYPEGHPESASQSEDLKYLKRKIEAGVDFVTTQLFFDNNRFFHFLYRLRDLGVDTPVIAGIMPITKAAQIKRAAEMSGATPPRRFTSLLDRFADRPDALEQAGMIYATEQITDLIANNVNGVHIYTMNQPWVAETIQKNISALL